MADGFLEYLKSLGVPVDSLATGARRGAGGLATMAGNYGKSFLDLLKETMPVAAPLGSIGELINSPWTGGKSNVLDPISESYRKSWAGGNEMPTFPSQALINRGASPKNLVPSNIGIPEVAREPLGSLAVDTLADPLGPLGGILGGVAAAATLPPSITKIPQATPGIVQKLRASLGKVFPTEQFLKTFGKVGQGVTQAEADAARLGSFVTNEPRIKVSEEMVNDVLSRMPEWARNKLTTNETSLIDSVALLDTPYYKGYAKSPAINKRFMSEVMDLNMAPEKEYTPRFLRDAKDALDNIPDETRLGGIGQYHGVGAGRDFGPGKVIGHYRGGAGDVPESESERFFQEFQHDRQATLDALKRNKLLVTPSEKEAAIKDIEGRLSALASNTGIDPRFQEFADIVKSYLSNARYDRTHGYLNLTDQQAQNPFWQYFIGNEQLQEDLDKARKLLTGLGHPADSFNQAQKYVLMAALDDLFRTGRGSKTLNIAPAHLAGTASYKPTELVTGFDITPQGNFSLYGRNFNTQAQTPPDRETLFQSNIFEPISEYANPFGFDYSASVPRMTESGGVLSALGLGPKQTAALMAEIDKPFVANPEWAGARDRIKWLKSDEFRSILKDASEASGGNRELSDLIFDYMSRGGYRPHQYPSAYEIENIIEGSAVNPSRWESFLESMAGGDAPTDILRKLMPPESVVSRYSGGPWSGPIESYSHQFENPFTAATQMMSGKSMMGYYPTASMGGYLNEGTLIQNLRKILKESFGLEEPQLKIMSGSVPGLDEEKHFAKIIFPEDFIQEYRKGNMLWPTFFSNK